MAYPKHGYKPEKGGSGRAFADPDMHAWRNFATAHMIPGEIDSEGAKAFTDGYITPRAKWAGDQNTFEHACYTAGQDLAQAHKRVGKYVLPMQKVNAQIVVKKERKVRCDKGIPRTPLRLFNVISRPKAVLPYSQKMVYKAIQMDAEGNTVKEWPSVAAAAAGLGLTTEAIAAACNKRNPTGVPKTAGRSYWRYGDKHRVAINKPVPAPLVPDLPVRRVQMLDATTLDVVETFSSRKEACERTGIEYRALGKAIIRFRRHGKKYKPINEFYWREVLVEAEPEEAAA